MSDERTLTIDGDVVTFRIRYGGQAQAVPLDFDPSKVPPSTPILVGRTKGFAAVLQEEPKSELDEYADAELERLWRERRGHRQD